MFLGGLAAARKYSALTIFSDLSRVQAEIAVAILRKAHRKVRPRIALCSAIAATRVFQKVALAAVGLNHASEETGALIQRLRPPPRYPVNYPFLPFHPAEIAVTRFFAKPIECGQG
ncbi:hypothetical protein G5714_012795 [Onychostoma macrolepis]|uniref:Uncharacterized protein n=1 Tax=Onychostoma macrolepis TaxID=369639 RepID=A0A7J6CJP7_9TELE|nr:hypothetical protein G5714_012795 [Onychostoma macrolepis]